MTRRLDFIDLKAQQERLRPQLLERLNRVLEHGQYILGPEVFELEERLAEYVGVRHVISCASGTDALLMTLMAWGIGPGDAVFTTPFTFVATLEVICLVGATPILVDIDPRTYNLDPQSLEATLADFGRSPRTAGVRPRAVIPVDLFGQPADYERINALAARHGLLVLEDAAQSFGAEYQGKKAGALAHAAATSFFPAKPLGGYGDGGAIFTDDDELAEILRSIRVHGQGRHRYEHVRLGLNGRLDTLQAAVLLCKLEIFPEEVARRQEVAERYSQALAGDFTVPYVAPGCRSVWAQYSIQSPRREEYRARLEVAGIPTAVYYPLPLHLQPAYAFLGYQAGDFPVSEAVAQRIFSLPMHPYLTPPDQDRIIQLLLS